MTYRNLGNSGLSVFPLALGTMQFGWTADEETSFNIMDAFTEAGGNLVDTADVYSMWAPNNPAACPKRLSGAG